jgi:hypothetical protein
MELGVLAMSVAALLARSFVESAGSDAGKGAWAGAKRLYSVIRHRFADDREAGRALDTLKGDPMKQENVEALAATIGLKLAEDQQFRSVVEQFVREAAEDEESAAVINQFQGNVTIGKQVNMRDVHGSVTF